MFRRVVSDLKFSGNIICNYVIAFVLLAKLELYVSFYDICVQTSNDLMVIFAQINRLN